MTELQQLSNLSPDTEKGWIQLLDMAMPPAKPVGLEKYLVFHTDELNLDRELFNKGALFKHLQTSKSDPNDTIKLKFGTHLSKWDYAVDQPSWVENTESGTEKRREKIYELLSLNEVERKICDDLYPHAPHEHPTVIASEHEQWYTPARRSSRSFYWSAYAKHLEGVMGWPPEIINVLDESTRSVVERLTNPEREEAYQTKGLVVGYVQSGKTANFTGVVARAVDAGYRLIIVLAGTVNILRDQTQFRLDRDMVGLEMLGEDYDTVKDKSKFLRHGGIPEQMGQFNWQRLTGPSFEYQELKRGIDALEFEKRDKTKPFYHPENLHTAKARLLVIKKHPSVMKKVITDLKKIKTRLEDIPTLIIDDESDQASINTIDPVKITNNERTATNKAIVNLLGILPRAQYLGYTATPFANVFINHRDAADIFPKDYILSLPKPIGYMGAEEFLTEYGEPEPHDFSPAKRPYVRGIQGDDITDNLLRDALDSYILSGAIKLYRQDKSSLEFKHHTMLVHHSVKQDDHDDVARNVLDTLENAQYRSGPGIQRLAKLLEEDYRIVHGSEEPRLPFPSSIMELKPYLEECLTRVKSGRRPVLILNGRNYDDAPDYEAEEVWKIIVGGQKLSRGYTVEGLTTSFYRRTASTADSLMQMGRWFGFRKGYQDLVRLYVGINEQMGRNKTLNLFEAFRAISEDERSFRGEIKRYSDIEDGIKPYDIPPLVCSHLLMPTAKNKMHNTEISFMNFSEKYLEKGTAVEVGGKQKANIDLVRNLASRNGLTESSLEMGNEKVRALYTEIGSENLIEFLKQYHWPEDKRPYQRAIEFLENEKYDPEIDSWLILMPLKAKETEHTIEIAGKQASIFKRARVHKIRFSVFSEPRHRIFSEYLCGLNEGKANDALARLQKSRQGVMLLYPVICEDYDLKDGTRDDNVTMGFGLQFPKNNIQVPISFSVRNGED